MSMRAKIFLVCIGLLLSVSPHGSANENNADDLYLPEDIPLFIGAHHNIQLGSFALVNFREGSLIAQNESMRELVDNLIRAEVLYFLTNKEDISLGLIFNELALFNTYQILIDTAPSKIWRDLTYQSTDPRFVKEQIDTAYKYYHNRLLALSDELINDYMPPISEPTKTALAKN